MLISYQYSHAPGRVVDEFPGGGIEDGEETIAAARRELAEKCNVRIRNGELENGHLLAAWSLFRATPPLST